MSRQAGGPLRLCIVGATGRMGSLVAREASPERFVIKGAVAGADDPGVGKTLRELGAKDVDTKVSPPSRLPDLLQAADVCISFTSAAAEMSNYRAVAESKVPYVSGTTGLTAQQRREVETALTGRLPAVIASNFSVGANFLVAISAALKALPGSFDVSVVEAHHSGKVDAPSGTALSIAKEVMEARGYTKTVSGRSGASKRAPDELEVLSLRGGGTPGIHTVHAFGPHEMITLEHLAFSRSAFALGALHAAEWVTAKEREPRVYGMADVLGLKL
ncbi:MAG TPA: 4-hydroxy-tetrahydrodipicolinate reductase [Nitrososphaerales archaeon]|nr:4-hydroxy-tetrahydrodipicolinate reductase [Nitrososphaerales archaeon]